jgi:hypothetical protein
MKKNTEAEFLCKFDATDEKAAAVCYCENLQYIDLYIQGVANNLYILNV